VDLGEREEPFVLLNDKMSKDNGREGRMGAINIYKRGPFSSCC